MWQDLDENEQELVRQFIRDYRAAFAETVRGLNMQELLGVQYANTIAPLWAQINNGEIIPDGSGLAGADTTMTKSEFTPKFQWTGALLTAVFGDGGAVATVWADRDTVIAYAVELAGPGNVT